MICNDNELNVLISTLVVKKNFIASSVRKYVIKDNVLMTSPGFFTYNIS